MTSTLPAAASTGGGAAGPAAGTTAAQRTVDSHPAEGGHLPSTASGSSRLRALHYCRKELRDKLAGAERDIKKKETVKETLAEKLKRLDEQLDWPGLRAEDKDHLIAKWRSVDDDKRVSNAALAGLYADQRRIKDDVAALEQEIAAEEAARRKADNEVRVSRLLFRCLSCFATFYWRCCSCVSLLTQMVGMLHSVLDSPFRNCVTVRSKLTARLSTTAPLSTTVFC